MTKKEQIVAKYTKKTVERIVGLIRSDTYTIAEICGQTGITPKTYREWRNAYPEFDEAVKNAEEERKQAMVQVAKKSLLRKLQGYDVTETVVVTVPSREKDKSGKTIEKPRIKEQRTTRKHVAADTTAIIFTLTNGDPENWRNRQSTEVTGKDGKDLFSQKTDEELDSEIEELRRKLDIQEEENK